MLAHRTITIPSEHLLAGAGGRAGPGYVTWDLVLHPCVQTPASVCRLQDKLCPIHRAALLDEYGCLKVLLDAGADVNATGRVR